ncbi:MAG: hypothetical protein CMF54_03675 [Legionellales bacterium]|nr:hypothetical protein [Legionellales bacterium]
MEETTLSQLSKDFSAGKVDKDKYIEKRQRLIRKIISGSVILKDKNYIPHKSIKNRKSSSNIKKIMNLQNRRPLYIAIITLVIISVILITSVFVSQQYS